MGDDVPPQQRVEDMIRVAELCVDLLKENEEHHGEVRKQQTFFHDVQFNYSGETKWDEAGVI